MKSPDYGLPANVALHGSPGVSGPPHPFPTANQAEEKTLKLRIDVELKKEDGTAVDPDEVAEQLTDKIESISTLYVSGSGNENETEYSIIEATLQKVVTKR